IFNTIKDQTTFDIQVPPREIASGFLGRVSLEARIRFHLENGEINFQNNNTISIDELDIDWDQLSIRFNFDIREVCTPRICIPLLGCTPQWCIFESDSDFSIPLSIPAIFTSEISANLRPKVYYSVGDQNIWQIFLDPVGPVDLDLIDVADTIGDLLDNAIKNLVDSLGLPGIVEDILGALADVIRSLLDIADDVGEWIADLIFNTLGISFSIEQIIANWLANKSPIFSLEDPVEVLPAEGDLIPVKVPIQYIGAAVNSDELALSVDINS
ncbi:MAG: hypothetical protein AAF696_34120, partial [Bacteroidota bacterium]